MKGYSVFQRKGRAAWYITVPVAGRGWTQMATPFRVEDPAGERKAGKLARELSEKYHRLKDHDAKAESWSRWVPRLLRARYRGATLERYFDAWDNLQLFMDRHHVTGPGQWRREHNDQYVAWRTSQKRNNRKPYTRNTAIYELKLLGIVMREALLRGLISANPCERMGLMRDAPKEKRALTDADIAKLRTWAAAKESHLPITERWRTVSLEVALHQGCRLRETAVPMCDIDEALGTIKFTGKGRNNLPRVFTTRLHPGLLPLIAELRAAGAAHTCTLPKMAAKEWFFGFREAGVEGASFHCTRVTLITRLARGRVPEQMARRYVNHASKAVHSVYQKLGIEDLAACIDALPLPPRPGEIPSGPSATA